MIYINSFVFAGLVCVIGQVLMDKLNFKPGEVTSLFVVVGSFLEVFNIYDWFIEKFGAGSMVVITSFGHLLTHGIMDSIKSNGILGLFTGTYSLTSSGISSTILFAFLCAILFKPRN